MFTIISTSRADMDCGNGRLRQWSDIEKDRDQLRSQARQKADSELDQHGHQMTSWSSINSAHCNKCGRQAKITNILGRDKASFNGPAFENLCDDTDVYSSRDKWHWEFNAQME